MKSFFSTFFASCLGVFAAFTVGIFILIGIGASGISKSTSYSDGTILKLKLEDFIPEKTDNVSQQSIFSGITGDVLGLNAILKLLDAAAEDKKIIGIIIENTNVSVGQATILSLLEGLEKFKESGKFIYSYSDFHSQSSYLLSSVADSMFLNPQGSIDLKGFGAAIPFFKDMFDKIGIEMNVFYAGNFKSATEPFRLNEMSEYNKIQTRAFLEDMKDVMVDKIASNRKVEKTTIEGIMSNYTGRNGKLSLENKLVDDLFYQDQFDDFIRKKCGLGEGKTIKTITLSKYNSLANPASESSSKEKIAIVHLEGEIMYGTKEPGIISEMRYLKILSKIRFDDKIKAVVLRINSPGGNAFTSDLIWREIEKIKESGKPVIASFGDYAASGGYYIAAGADKIVSQPNTLTGSIGVFMMFPNATKLLNQKIGITFDTIKTDPFANGFSPFIELAPREKEILQESTLEIYELFIDRVSKGRKLSIDSTKQIAQGRVWTGRMAKEIGLVDEIGNLSDALKLAAEAAGISSYKTVEYPFIEQDIYTTILREIQKGQDEEARIGAFAKSIVDKKLLSQYENFKAIYRCKEPTARLPLIFDFQ